MNIFDCQLFFDIEHFINSLITHNGFVYEQ